MCSSIFIGHSAIWQYRMVYVMQKMNGKEHIEPEKIILQVCS